MFSTYTTTGATGARKNWMSWSFVCLSAWPKAMMASRTSLFAISPGSREPPHTIVDLAHDCVAHVLVAVVERVVPLFHSVADLHEDRVERVMPLHGLDQVADIHEAFLLDPDCSSVTERLPDSFVLGEDLVEENHSLQLVAPSGVQRPTVLRHDRL